MNEKSRAVEPERAAPERIWIDREGLPNAHILGGLGSYFMRPAKGRDSIEYVRAQPPLSTVTESFKPRCTKCRGILAQDVAYQWFHLGSGEYSCLLTTPQDCPLFNNRGFHDWRYLGYPLTNPGCTEHWCSVCKLRQVPKVVNGKPEWIDAGYKTDAGCVCQRCGTEYKVDFNVPDDLWEKIRGKWNLLCGPCITKLIERRSEFDYLDIVKPAERADLCAQPSPSTAAGDVREAAVADDAVTAILALIDEGESTAWKMACVRAAQVVRALGIAELRQRAAKAEEEVERLQGWQSGLEATTLDWSTKAVELRTQLAAAEAEVTRLTNEMKDLTHKDNEYGDRTSRG